MAKFTNSPILTARYTQAVEIALSIHSTQIRKGHIECPYITHLFTVSSLVLEAGGTEDEAIAALLHDSIEDAKYPIDAIEHYFGNKVAKIVTMLTEEPNNPHAKEDYIYKMSTADLSVIKVSLADKLHNARCYVTNSHLITQKVVDFFTQLFEIYSKYKNINKGINAQIRELHILINEMESCLN